MNDSQKAPENLSRGSVFLIGSAVTALLAGLVVLCVPKKPEVIADSALPQNVSLPTGEAGGAAPVASPAVEESASNAAAATTSGGTGERLYARFCASCHGADGKAGTTMARMMNPAPTNFHGGPWKGEQTTAAIIEVVKNGKGAMPAYGKEISQESELNALAEHVLSLRKGTPE